MRAAVFGTVHFVITCARDSDVAAVELVGEARARRADDNTAARVEVSNNIVCKLIEG